MSEASSERQPDSAKDDSTTLASSGASCRRELELEIPAEEVQKAAEKVARDFARIARIPGFRPGKAPVSLIRRRFAEDIKGEVVQSLVPQRVEKAVAEQKLLGTPAGGGEPLQASSVLCHIGAEETLEAFNENLKGANVGEHKNFDVNYPADYPDAKLAGKTYHYSVEVLAIKMKKLPELNDELAKDVSDFKTLDELRADIRMRIEQARDQRQKELVREKILAALVKSHDFPVPESLVEHQMDVRLERVVRSLAAQGVDPRAVNVDWVTLRRRQRERAAEDVKAELIVDRIASAENIDVTEEELQRELEHMAEHAGESATALRARLTKQGALDRMKAKLRSDKTLDWLAQNSRIRTVAAAAAK